MCRDREITSLDSKDCKYVYRNDGVSMIRVFAIRRHEGQHNYENMEL
jgi:hypothetical protein